MTRFRLQLRRNGTSFSSSEDEEEEEEEEEEDEIEEGTVDGSEYDYPVSSPLISTTSDQKGRQQGKHRNQQQQFSLVSVLVSALRKSLVTCSVDPGEDVCSSMDIGWPTDVQHVSHVTFDRYNGFLGLPMELEPELPGKVPSASASVFGVSAHSMQCSYDNRGNSIPTILLLMQRHLYSQGGLQAEGIFRINAENGQEIYVRDALNKGIVPQGVDLHCLAGLIKAWFRELPTGVLDSLTPEQVMHCNTEEECSLLISLLPPVEAALLDWAINLMTDVVQNECYNKMNARNIAMVFAPNMTQMADPLTALIHAVQVMNLLKTLILKRLREREGAAVDLSVARACSEPPRHRDEKCVLKSTEKHNGDKVDKSLDTLFFSSPSFRGFMLGSKHESESDAGESFHSLQKTFDGDKDQMFISGKSSPVSCDKTTEEKHKNGEESLFDRLSLKKGVKKLCSHAIFQLSKSMKKSDNLGTVNSHGRTVDPWT